MGTPRAPAVDVAAIRAGLYFNQAQLADVLGVHAMTVSKWERGELVPDPWRRVMLGRAAGWIARHNDAHRRCMPLELARSGAVEVLARLILRE